MGSSKHHPDANRIDSATDRCPISAHAARPAPGGVDPVVATRAARSNCTLLITGETGVGKGHLARWLHDQSPRAAEPFIPVNCGAIPESLAESQLFGHARGAFSGASREHVGFARAADHGTLLLDEVGELPSAAQTRLLRLLQEGEVQPVGESRPIEVDVRIIAATNIDLEAAVAARTFREDLYFRLDIIRLPVAPLRARRNEVLELLRAFNAELAAFYRQPILDFTDDALRMLLRHPWPGNIRQLRSVMERLHVLCPGETVDVERLRAPAVPRPDQTRRGPARGDRARRLRPRCRGRPGRPSQHGLPLAAPVRRLTGRPRDRSPPVHSSARSSARCSARRSTR